MNASRLILSVSLSLAAGLSMTACDKDGVVLDELAPDLEPDEQDDASPAGLACDTPNAAITCESEPASESESTEQLVSYCSFATISEAAEGWGELAQGECVAPSDNECEPGQWRNEPNDDDELCGGTQYACQAVNGDAMWVEIPCNTPLVLRFDAAPIEMIAAEATPAATFDINMRADSCITTDWPTAATPWLVVDRDHSGTIDGGHELFGSGTTLATGRHAEHGFAALSEFDTNADGIVDTSDDRFAEIMLWRDHDADRLSTPDELEPLSAAGVTELAVDYTIDRQCDERGNCGVQRSAFEFAGGTGEVVDLYLTCH